MTNSFAVSTLWLEVGFVTNSSAVRMRQGALAACRMLHSGIDQQTRSDVDFGLAFFLHVLVYPLRLRFCLLVYYVFSLTGLYYGFKVTAAATIRVWGAVRPTSLGEQCGDG